MSHKFNNMARVSAGERTAILKSGNGNMIHDLKQGDIYAAKGDFVNEALAHRSLQENLYKNYGYNKHNTESLAAYGWNSAIIHHKNYATQGMAMGYTFDQLFAESKTRPHYYEPIMNLDYSNAPFMSRNAGNNKTKPASNTSSSTSQNAYYNSNVVMHQPSNVSTSSSITTSHLTSPYAPYSISEPKDIDLSSI